MTPRGDIHAAVAAADRRLFAGSCAGVPELHGLENERLAAGEVGRQ